jgi:hypothetical protein
MRLDQRQTFRIGVDQSILADVGGRQTRRAVALS